MDKPMPPRSANRSGKSTPTKRNEDAEEEEQKLKREEEEKASEAKRKLEEERIETLKAIREIQEQETENELNNIKNVMLNLRKDLAFDPEWERYLRCDGRPDPTSLTQINTFIALLKEKKDAGMNSVLEEADLILALIHELNKIAKDPEQTLTPEQLETYKKTTLSLQDLLICRYNDATLHLLKEATYEADSETGNLQKVISGSNEALMLWGNLNKNPRFKSYEFDGEKFQFELPKLLAMADIAVRVLKTDFDHYSHQCSTFLPKEEKPTEVDVENAPQDEEKNQTADVVKDKKPEDEEDKDDVKSTATPDGRKSEMSVASNKDQNEAEKTEDEQDETAPEAEVEEPKPIELEFDEILDPDVVDLRQFNPLGGIYHVDLIEMPPQPKALKGWTLTQIIDKPLTNMSYPSGQLIKTTSRAPSAVPDSRDGGVTPTKTPSEQQHPPIGITMNLPSNVMFFEEPQVAVWDETDLHWKTKGITDANFDEEKRVVSFKTNEFGVFSLSQDGHLNMPFQSWELRPKNVDSSVLTITGAIAEVEIEIKGKKCRLNPPAEEPPAELAHIHNNWLNANELVEAMKKAGVNLFPASDSHKFVSIQNKIIDMEKVYEQMAILSTGFAFSWSKWNNDATKNKIVFQVAPFLPTGKPYEPGSVPDDAWSTFIVDDDRCYMLAISEFDDVFNDAIASGCGYHCDVLHAVRQSSKRGEADQNHEAAVKRSTSTDAFYVDTVHSLLKATKFITFS